MELLQGFISILNPVTMLLIIGGVLGGLVIGALPGLSAFTALAIMLPFTFGMEPVNGISFLMAVYAVSYTHLDCSTTCSRSSLNCFPMRLQPMSI